MMQEDLINILDLAFKHSNSIVTSSETKLEVLSPFNAIRITGEVATLSFTIAFVVRRNDPDLLAKEL